MKVTSKTYITLEELLKYYESNFITYDYPQLLAILTSNGNFNVQDERINLLVTTESVLKLWQYVCARFINEYILIDDTKIELNFDTDCIQLEYDFIETQESELYGCELPMIPNDGVLIEALTYFCMYKMLTRGYKHPVMNLAASQYGTNPYYIWLQMKEQAKRSIINRNFDRDMDDSSRMFRSALYIDTFDPKRS